MRIMVLDVPAESGGALSVLNDFYNEYKKDEENEYVFVISTPQLQATSNIKVLRFPWIKRSWFHRLYFDYFIAPKLVKEHKVDEVFSLQNVIIPCINTSQTVYVHNSLPFSEYKFTFMENKLLWIYQNIISKVIFKSMKKANKVIVQTNWMKDESMKRLNIKESKIEVRPPEIIIDRIRKYDEKLMEVCTFFYPASGVDFKNHKIIIDACTKLSKITDKPYRVIFTLTGKENESIKDIYKIARKRLLPIEFLGVLEREEVFKYYSRSILLFASYIESSPLPLTEARLHDAPILASDYAFSHEILDSYNNVTFFDAFDSEDLMQKMKRYI